ncbi:MAG: hypothetical protein R3B72_02395 [Polyangiaceae bacterium]
MKDVPAEADEEAPRDEDDEAGDEAQGPVDQMGIPMSREPTIDDVRGDGDAHRRLALGCSALVTLLVIAFWVVRVVWLGAD